MSQLPGPWPGVDTRTEVSELLKQELSKGGPTKVVQNEGSGLSAWKIDENLPGKLA